jgi:hypothetical protein
MKRPQTKVGDVVDRLLEQLGDPPTSHAQTDAATDRVLQRLRSSELGEPYAMQDGDFISVSAPSIAVPRWGWTLAAVTLIALCVLPFFISRPKPIANAPAEMSPEAVMERLNRHLAGTVPEPMEPMLSLISGEQPKSEKGEVQ